MNDCCKDNLISTTGKVTHFVRHQQINILNIPHYRCKVCDYVEYDIKKVKPIKYLKFALANHLKDIDYEHKI